MRTKRTPRSIVTPRQPPRPYARRITLIIQKWTYTYNWDPITWPTILAQKPSWLVCDRCQGQSSVEFWALWSSTQVPQSRAKFASVKGLLARPWRLTGPSCSGGYGTTHETPLRWHLTILHHECTRGFSSTVGKKCRLPFSPSFYLMFENPQHFSLFYFSFTKLSRLSQTLCTSFFNLENLLASTRSLNRCTSFHSTHDYVLASFSNWRFYYDHIA